MEEKKFSKAAVVPENDKWAECISRCNPLYDRADDIRSPFARDYTRVLHSLAYRRLKHKTQVFFNAEENDHICTRIEHVQHVESVSNTIAKELGLNEELTRAIAIAHDLGHAPFGHQGETVIKKLSKEFLGKDFWHEQNGLYFVDYVELLEDNQKKLKNLDLTYAVKDGIISHCGELNQNSIRPRNEMFDLKKFDGPGKYQAATWEGCVVKLSDKIAYLGRDIEDAIRLGLLTKEKIDFLQEMAKSNNQYAINTTVIMHNMIIDLCNNSSIENGLTLSSEMSKQLDKLKDFNYEYIYKNPKFNTFNKYSNLVINEIFNSLMNYYDNNGQEVLEYLAANKFDGKYFVEGFVKWIIQYCNMDFHRIEGAKEIADNCLNVKIYGDLSDRNKYIQAVIDYIAGMTDIYAVKSFEELLHC